MAPIIEQVKLRGDDAVREYTKKASGAFVCGYRAGPRQLRGCEVCIWLSVISCQVACIPRSSTRRTWTSWWCGECSSECAVVHLVWTTSTHAMPSSLRATTGTPPCPLSPTPLPTLHKPQLRPHPRYAHTPTPLPPPRPGPLISRTPLQPRGPHPHPPLSPLIPPAALTLTPLPPPPPGPLISPTPPSPTTSARPSTWPMPTSRHSTSHR